VSSVASPLSARSNVSGVPSEASSIKQPAQAAMAGGRSAVAAAAGPSKPGPAATALADLKRQRRELEQRVTGLDADIAGVQKQIASTKQQHDDENRKVSIL